MFSLSFQSGSVVLCCQEKAGGMSSVLSNMPFYLITVFYPSAVGDLMASWNVIVPESSSIHL